MSQDNDVKRSLPPLAALRVFDAVVRRLNFTRAAEELGMTQAAVSHQIKLLEEKVGATLFLRGPRGIALTETARRLGPNVVEAFNLLRDTFEDGDGPRERTLNINTTYAYATRWLAPRLGSFSVAHPDLAVRLEATERVIDFSHEDVDVVIRAGQGRWAGLTAVKVLDVEYAPMLSPTLATSAGGIREPADLLALPLLDPRHEWWPLWLKANGLSLDALAQQAPAALHTQGLDADAAMKGGGVALLTPSYYRAELASGQLIQPFPSMLEDRWSYWLAYPESRRNVHRVKVFRDWLVAEATR